MHIDFVFAYIYRNDLPGSRYVLRMCVFPKMVSYTNYGSLASSRVAHPGKHVEKSYEHIYLARDARAPIVDADRYPPEFSS